MCPKLRPIKFKGLIMYIKFDLKKYNTSGLSYKDDGQIPSQKIKNNKIINTNSIPFQKPYKIQVRANKMVNSKRTNIKRTYTFLPSITLLDAVKECAQNYIRLMNTIDINKLKRDELNESTPFGIIWEYYLNYKVEQYKGRSDKTEFDKKSREGFYNNHLKKDLDLLPVNQITHEDLVRVISKMKNAQSGKTLSERTKRKVYQFVNPVYSYLKMKRINLESPASLHGLPPLNNTRKIDLSIEDIKSLFLRLRDYKYSPFREVFMWLMHGRRLNEVLTLEWTDIDLDNNLYTIKKENNKARIDMRYILTKRLRNTLNELGIKKNGYVFTSINDPRKHLTDGTLRIHWEKLNLPIVKHQIRNCIQVYLKNVHAVPRDIVDSIIGHKQSTNVGDRYGNYQEQILSEKLNLMLDEIFDDEYVNKTNLKDNKLEKLKVIFPDKSEKELLKVLEIL